MGDAILDDRGALVGAATEALINAAQHSGTSSNIHIPRSGGGRRDVWVTDQGKGFDQEDSPGRQARAGGFGRRKDGPARRQRTESRPPGEGTEVHLVMPGVKAMGATA